MYRPIATLNLPEYKINELHNKGFIYWEDVNIEKDHLTIGIQAETWKELNINVDTKTAVALCEDESDCSQIVTFSSALDELLVGGVPTKMITEFFGLPGSGKSQICLQLSVSVQMPDCFGGIEGHAIYIDSNFGFTLPRLTEIAQGCINYCKLVADNYNSFDMFESLKTITENNILKGIYYLHITTFIELLSVLTIIKKMLIKDPQIKLILIDGITDPVKNTNLEYFDRIKVIYTFLSDLQNLANIHKFAIVITNDMTTKFDEQGNSYVAPSFGDSFGHRMNNRIFLERISDTVFSATFTKSVLKKFSKAAFQIVSAGIRDVAENVSTYY